MTENVSVKVGEEATATAQNVTEQLQIEQGGLAGQEKGAEESPRDKRAESPSSGKKDKGGAKGFSRFLPSWFKQTRSSSAGGKRGADKLRRGSELQQAEVNADGKDEEVKSAEKEVEGELEKNDVTEEATPKRIVPQLQESAKRAPGKLQEQLQEQKEKAVATLARFDLADAVATHDTEPSGGEQPAAVVAGGGGDAEEAAKEATAEEAAKEEAGEAGAVEGVAPPSLELATLSGVSRSRRVKEVECSVLLLDGTQFACKLPRHAKGHELFHRVCEHLNLLERDYFSLTYKDASDQKNWLDPIKEIKKQLMHSPWLVSFNVKFYPPDPSHLLEDISRYYLCLQLREDVARGRLPCLPVVHALLGSYALQAELGDYDAAEHGAGYAGRFQLAPNQTHELQDRMAELHAAHRGQSPAEAELHYLENAKTLAMYGVELHRAKCHQDSEGVDIKLGVCANGLLVYRDRLRINRFAWPKILKISYRRSNFFIKVRPGEFEKCESTVGFKLPSHRAAKRLWKTCVEHHTFFRMAVPEPTRRARFMSLGSRFRYSGRTQAQTRQASARIGRPGPPFVRVSSRRQHTVRSLDGGWRKDVIVLTEETAGSSTEQRPAMGWVVDEEERLEWRGCAVDESEQQGLRLKSTKERFPGYEDKRADDLRKPKSENEEVEVEEDDRERKKYQIMRIDGDNIYVRHSKLMLEGTGRTKEELTRHKMSISELKRHFMESVPPPQMPSEWDKRLSSGSPGRVVFHNGQSPTVKTAQTTESWSQGGSRVLTSKGASSGAAADSPSQQQQLVTRTVTYETPKSEGIAEGQAGTLMSAQTITSESVCTSTTTHITKIVKDGISETRIEKRIVIAGDETMDHDQALVEAIKEAKKQHPGMSVTRVVVHKESEVVEDDRDNAVPE
ncbi:protein 4.1-like isoform X6 [Lampetra planeri]